MRKGLWRNATTRGLARSACCARISTSAPAGGVSTSMRFEPPWPAPLVMHEDAMLNTDLNLADPDGFYEALVDTHRDLTPEQSRLVNAKLVHLLANHIGDPTVPRFAMAKARQSV